WINRRQRCGMPLAWPRVRSAYRALRRLRGRECLPRRSSARRHFRPDFCVGDTTRGPMNSSAAMIDPISRLLRERDVLLADGAMGTNLFVLGLQNGAPGELWNVEQPDSVRSVYQGFVDSGSAIILTNTFGANRFRFALHKLQGRVRELNVAATELARD